MNTEFEKKFEKLDDAKKPTYVLHQVQKLLQEGTLRPGDRLPPESRLAELTGVSRSSVREALTALRILGVVETKTGAGSFVKSSKDLGAVEEHIANVIGSLAEVGQLQEARHAFEKGIIELAIERLDEDDIDEFEENLLKLRVAAENDDYDGFIQNHTAFHFLIAQCTGNVIIEKTASTLLGISQQDAWQGYEREYYLPNERDSLQEAMEIHKSLFRSLRRKDIAQTMQLMEQHYAKYR